MRGAAAQVTTVERPCAQLAPRGARMAPSGYGRRVAAREYPASIAEPVERELVVKKSRFIAHVHPATSVSEAEAVITETRRRYWDARHNCTAMVTGVLGDQARSSDDGEPSGTAGVPMLEVLRRRELTDVVAVVTRYFGGVLLGAGGLVRAYSSAVSAALDEARLVRRQELVRATVVAPAVEAGRVEHLLRSWTAQHGGVLDPPAYALDASFDVWVSPDHATRLSDDFAAATAGAHLPVFGETRIVDVPG